MKCKNCGFELNENAKFCGACGKPVVDETIDDIENNLCTSCGAKLNNGAKFCGACGRIVSIISEHTELDDCDSKCVSNIEKISDENPVRSKNNKKKSKDKINQKHNNKRKSIGGVISVGLALVLLCSAFIVWLNYDKLFDSDDELISSSVEDKYDNQNNNQSSDVIITWKEDKSELADTSSEVIENVSSEAEYENLAESSEPAKDEDIPYNSQIVYVKSNGSSATLSLSSYENGDWIEMMSAKALIGENGTTNYKSEGDKSTPIGSFDINFVFGLSQPNTKLTFKKVTKNTVWVDDENSAYYNTWQSSTAKYKDWKSSEALYSKFSAKKANYCIAFNFNGNCTSKNSAEKGRGSVIFIEGVASKGSFKPGYGDIKISDSSMKKLLSLLDSAKHPKIQIS